MRKRAAPICNCKCRESYTQAMIGHCRIVEYDEDECCVECGRYIRWIRLTDEQFELIQKDPKKQSGVYVKTVIPDFEGEGYMPKETEIHVPNMRKKTFPCKRKGS